MASIHLLDDQIINKIAAGEVVERPASVLKELVENAIDAGSTFIDIELMEGGKNHIAVFDDGKGIASDELDLAVTRHATSKIDGIDDLFSVQSMGFRGEALASIASVSQFSLISRQRGATEGVKVKWLGGDRQESQPYSCKEGTQVIVDELFYNVPARSKFLKSTASEFAHCLELIQAYALANPGVGFRLIHNKKEKLAVRGIEQPSPQSGFFGEDTLRKRAYEVWGEQQCRNFIYVSDKNQYGAFEALVSGPGVEKATGKNMVFFVNGRWVKDKVLRYGVLRGYQSHLLKGKFPQVIGYMTIDPTLIDVNVHPSKTELRFQYAGEVQGLLAVAIRKALRQGDWSGVERKATSEGVTSSVKQSSFTVDKGIEEFAQSRSTGMAFPSKVRNEAGSSAKPERNFSKMLEYSSPLTNGTHDKKTLGLQNQAPEILQASAPRLERFEKQEQIPWQEGRLIGSYANCYQILDFSEYMLLIDQHAFHERILFERLCNDVRLLQDSQPLMIPEALELNPVEIARLAENRESYHKIGFDYKIISDSTIEVKAVPSILAGKNYEHLFLELASSRFEGASTSGHMLPVSEHVLATIACHSAVRAGESVGEQEWKQLLSEAAKVDFYLNCPHGRRVFKRFSKREVEAWFDRV